MFYSTLEQVSKGEANESILYVEKMISDCKKNIDEFSKSDINSVNPKTLILTILYLSFAEYLEFYGQKHTDIDPLLRSITSAIPSSVLEMSLFFKKGLNKEDISNHYNEMQKIWLNNSREPQYIDKVNDYCMQQDLNPAILLLFHKVNEEMMI